MDDRRFFREVDTEISPREKGQMSAAKGYGLEDCPYVESDKIMQWQEGWRSKQKSIRRASGIAE